MTLLGTVRNGTVVLEKGATLPDGTRVTVVADQLEQVPLTAKELLMRSAGCMTGLPPDMAENHDHYLHGSPKK